MAAPARTTESRIAGTTGRLSVRGVGIAGFLALLICLLQSPGQIAADTKLDLTANPIGFLTRAAHLWSPDAPMGQVQNQAYGYFFPHGAFFALGEFAHLPPWITQRLWWALLLTIGFVGVVRLAEALRVGSPASRIIAGAIFALSPRVLTTLGSISSETLPMMLAPWVLVPMVRVLDGGGGIRPVWQEALRSAVPVALMGAVNAVATLAALGVAMVWWLMHRPGRRMLRFGLWWAVGLLLACAWWVVPLLILSRVSPPFLDFIESSGVTTQWTSLTEVLRGTSSWTPFVSSERVAGAVLVTQPAAVLATGTLAAAGLAGLCMRHMPFRSRMVALVALGLVLMCVGFAGQLGSPIADDVRAFLDGAGAPLRNIHKFEPFVRLPLVLGVAHLLARVPLPGTVIVRESLSAFAHPQRSRPVAATVVVVVALIGAGSLMWTGQLAPAGAYREIPGYWQQTATWLSTHAAQPDSARQAPARALVVPGAPFADQLWGLTRDEPMQPLGDTPWAVRDAIPLTPPSAIRAMDSVQRAIANGRASPGLAPTLAQQGIRYVVLRADLAPDTSRSARPLLAQHALTGSPGIRRVAVFGPDVGAPELRDVVRDNGLRPKMPAIQIFEVAATGFPGTGPILVDTDGMARVAGGPESLAQLDDARTRLGLPPLGPSLLAADARRAGLPDAPVIVTDSPADRETDFGRVDDHTSFIRSAGDPRRTYNAVPDYPVEGQSLVSGEWLLDNRSGEVRVGVSGSAADATQPGQTSPANSAAAVFDGDPQTAWVSAGLQSAVGQWMRLSFTRPQSDLTLRITTAKALGPDVSSVVVATEAGSTVASGLKPGEPVTVTAPSGPTRWVQIRALQTANGSAGNQFALGEVSVRDLRSGLPITIRHRVTLPPLAPNTTVAQWLLTQELSGRASCVADPAADVARCAPGLGLAAETPGIFTRALQVPQPTPVTPAVVLRPRPGDTLNALLWSAGQIVATGPSAVTDPRGGPSAAVDGDPSTVWTAPEPAKERKKGERPPKADRDSTEPRLTLGLPARQRVESLRIVAPQGYPSAPTRVAVDLGTGPQIRDVGAGGVVRLDPADTDRITITVLRQRDLIEVNSLGFATQAPPGIAEIEINSRTSVPPADRAIDIGCDRGIGMTVSGQVIGLSVQTTADALRNGEPVVARPCSSAPIALGAGEQELSVNPGGAFTVDSVVLQSGSTTRVSQTEPAAVRDWSAVDRSVTVNGVAHQRVLVIPESTNAGWQARLGDNELTPIVVNGWQQGWVIPAGASGTVQLTYRFDSLYRWALVIGLILVGALLIAACWPLPPAEVRACEPRSPGERTLPSHQALRGSSLALLAPQGAGFLASAGVATLSMSWLLSGWWGLAFGIGVGALAAVLRPRTTVVLCFVSMMLTTVGLAAGPWHSPNGYNGFAWWVQLPALIAVLLAAWAAVWSVVEPDLSDDETPLSCLRNQRRAGSSTKA